MPYIAQQNRQTLTPLVDALFDELHARGMEEGELNYCISRLLRRAWDKNPRYATIARVVGVLVNVKDEFYRRFAIPYETEKFLQNGDI